MYVLYGTTCLNTFSWYRLFFLGILKTKIVLFELLCGLFRYYFSCIVYRLNCHDQFWICITSPYDVSYERNWRKTERMYYFFKSSISSTRTIRDVLNVLVRHRCTRFKPILHYRYYINNLWRYAVARCKFKIYFEKFISNRKIIREHSKKSNSSKRLIRVFV